MPVQVGDRYGRLTVVAYVDRPARGGHWECRCDCGSDKVVASRNLVGGGTKSCGCLASENRRRTGRIYGRCNLTHPDPAVRSARAKAAVHARYPGGNTRDLVSVEREARGGGCQECGATDRLEWHHRNPAQKSFEISRAKDFGTTAVAAELAKCDLLCRDCHRKTHAEAPDRLAALLGIEPARLRALADQAGVAWPRN